MTGKKFQAIRRNRGLSVVQFGLLLGYQGNDATISRTVRGYEARGDREDVPEHIGRLATMLDHHWQSVPRDWLFQAGVL
jgi:hypothetical protein